MRDMIRDDKQGQAPGSRRKVWCSQKKHQPSKDKIPAKAGPLSTWALELLPSSFIFQQVLKWLIIERIEAKGTLPHQRNLVIFFFLLVYKE